MRPKRQRTVHVTIKDRQTGFVCFGSIRVERRRITMNPTPGLILPSFADDDPDIESIFERLNDRQLRLGQLLQVRWFGVPS